MRLVASEEFSVQTAPRREMREEKTKAKKGSSVILAKGATKNTHDVCPNIILIKGILLIHG